MSEIAHLFVYGTLRPGEQRWAFLEPFVVDEGFDDAAAGALYDTGVGYPAAVFGGEGRIVGRTYPLLAHSRVRCLEVLDEVEGAVAGWYRRIALRTERGVAAWGYQYGSGLSLTPIRSGDWLRRHE
jgi:gamma-glutamylcyclotransferase (GGCT)/AIG2-like uncharacterized protein YtfP